MWYEGTCNSQDCTYVRLHSYRCDYVTWMVHEKWHGKGSFPSNNKLEGKFANLDSFSGYPGILRMKVYRLKVDWLDIVLTFI